MRGMEDMRQHKGGCGGGDRPVPSARRHCGTDGGVRAVTGDTALRLGRFFGTSGEFWLNLQKLYELRRAERKNGAAIARLPSLDDTDRPRAAG